MTTAADPDAVAPALLAQAGPAGLALATDRDFRLPPHLALINREVVEAVARARSRESDVPEVLLVEVPPRHGKSTLISQNTPAWYLGMFPDSRVILASYEADFAGTWGSKSRNLLEEHGPDLYGIQVDQRSNSARRWDLLGRKGGMVTAGVGGPITGKGAHLLIVDDPIKNAEQAMSEVIREKHWDWWLSTARTRLEPGAVVVVLMTRWHDGDLGGRLLADSEDGGDPVREIRLPALAGPGDPLGRSEGEALWPARYTAAYLRHTKKVMGPYWFAAMFQGHPTPDEGGIFARQYFRYFELLDQAGLVRLHQADDTVKDVGVQWCRKLQVVDIAASEKQTADYTVIAEVWVTPDRELLVRHVIRDRIPGPDQPGFLADHSTGVPIKVEGAFAYGTSVIQGARRQGLPVEAVYPDADKVTRASTAGVMYRAGAVYHLRGAEWLHDFELELLSFPAGEHDDQVDTIAYAARALADLPPLATGRKRGKGKTAMGGVRNQDM